MSGVSAKPTPAGVLVVRPLRISVIGAIAAAVVLGSMIVLGLMLRGSQDGIVFRPFDQVGLISVGVSGAAGIMLVARPRLKADEQGIAVRNVLGETYFPWAVVIRIAFPAGAHWAQVVLADDETHPLLAIQAMDRQRAVDALQAVRELHAKYAPPRPTLSPEAAERVRRRLQAEAAAAAARPLGRLEIIDRDMAAKGAKRRHKGRADRA